MNFPAFVANISLTNPALDLDLNAPGFSFAAMASLRETFFVELDRLLCRDCVDFGTDGTSFDLRWQTFTEDEAKCVLRAAVDWAESNGWKVKSQAAHAIVEYETEGFAVELPEGSAIGSGPS